MTAVFAFVAGVCYARSSLRRAVQKARNNFTKLYDHAIRSIDTAQEACGLLAKLPNLRLSTDQAARLDSKQSGLLHAIGRVFDVQASSLGLPAGAAEEASPVEVDWVRTPTDSVTKLPDRAALESNFALMQNAALERDFASGLLLVKIDKTEQLKQRFGIAGIQSFARKAAALICKSMREFDAACQFLPDTFAVLMPAVDEAAGRRAVEAVRSSIRRHPFRVDENGPEVLVTASYGFTLCEAGEELELVLNRARRALSESEKLGRNQLHIDDGVRLLACAAQGV